MQNYKFKGWLEDSGISKRPIADALSRCKRVESGLCLDLDLEYIKDKGTSLIDLLSYSADDERNQKPAPKEINFEKGANIRNGMASLRNAVKKYFEFCQSR